MSLQIASDIPFANQFPHTGAVVAFDLNIDNYLWDSNNRVVDNPKYRRNDQKKLAEAQRSMSRKANRAKKDGRKLSDSKNYQKDRKKVALIHSRIAARGEDFRHVLSKEYVKNHDCIFAEDLKVKNLMKNHKLAKAIAECAWSDFLHKVEYKSAIHDRVFIKVLPHHTTQTCSECGYVMSGDEHLTLGDREWICPNCHTYHVRDYNAAKNILAKGLASLSV